jgi:hypothetical protein
MQPKNVLDAKSSLWHGLPMNTPDKIIDALGDDAICDRLGITKDAVAKARKAGKLPALWYAALSEMAGRDLPRQCFSFKSYPAPFGFNGQGVA